MDSLGTNDFQVGDEIEFTHRIAPSMFWDIRGLLPQNVNASILIPNGNTITPTSDGSVVVFGGPDGIDIEISLTAIEEGLVESQYREGFAESYVDYAFTVAQMINPCNGSPATINNIGQSLLNNPIAVGETRSFCYFNIVNGTNFDMESGGIRIDGTVLTGPNTGDSFSYDGTGVGIVLDSDNAYYTIDIVGTAAGEVFITIEDDNGFFEDDITIVAGGLPVSLVGFSAAPTFKQTHLHWQTASESQNRGFHLQHSPDGLTWSTLTFVSGVGDSSVERDYEYIHQNPIPGTNYYRLEQEDYDGTRTLSEVVTAEFSGVGELSITPNPATELITVNSPLLAGGEDFILTVYDAAGRKFLEQRNALQLQVAELPAGVYTLLLKAGSTVQTERFVRQ
jgi:hypothetical protein